MTFHSRLTFRVVIYFASNPEIELTYDELAHRFGEDKDYMKSALNSSVKVGLLTRACRRPQRIGRPLTTISAGPFILRELGYEVQEDQNCVDLRP